MTEQERKQAALIGLSWADAKFGIEHGFCTATDFSDIAFPALSGDSPDQEDVVRLYLAEDEAAKRTVVEHVCKRKEPDDELSVRKWIFLELQSIRARNGENIGRTLDEVESLYADLDYPPTLARFVRYMPAAPEDIASGNVGENRMVEKLDEFLEVGIGGGLEMKRLASVLLCSAGLAFATASPAEEPAGEPASETLEIPVDDSLCRIPVPIGFRRAVELEESAPPTLEVRRLAFLVPTGWERLIADGVPSTSIEILLVPHPADASVAELDFESNRRALLDRIIGQAEIDSLTLPPDDPHRPGCPWREIGERWCCAGCLVPPETLSLGNSLTVPASQAKGFVVGDNWLVLVGCLRIPSNEEEDAKLREEAVRYLREFVVLNPVAEDENAARTPAEMARRLDRGLKSGSAWSRALYYLSIFVTVALALGSAVFGVVRLVAALQKAGAGTLGGEMLPRSVVFRSPAILRTLAAAGFATVLAGVPFSLLAPPVSWMPPAPWWKGIVVWAVFWTPSFLLCAFSAKAFAGRSGNPPPRPRTIRDVWASVPFWIHGWTGPLAILSIPAMLCILAKTGAATGFQSFSFLVLPQIASAVAKVGVALCAFAALRALRLPSESGCRPRPARAAAVCTFAAAAGRIASGFVSAASSPEFPLKDGVALIAGTFDVFVYSFLGLLLLRAASKSDAFMRENTEA
jgi:hypothetical protein